MRRFWTALLVVILLAGAGWATYTYYWLPQRAAAQHTEPETTTVVRGTIANTVSAIGTMTPEDEIVLSFRGSGHVADVYVTVGQTVSSGDLLAQLDTSDLVLVLALANANLEIAQTELAILQTPPEASDITAAEIAIDVADANVAAAEAAVASAQATYQRLAEGPSAAEIRLNEVEVRQAQALLVAAQAAYDEVKYAPNLGSLPQSLELQKATLALESAQAKAEVLLEPADNAQLVAAQYEIAQARYALERAKSERFNAELALEKLRHGPSMEELAIAHSRVQQAQLSKLQTENSLAASRLETPIDGIVSQVNIQRGEIPTANQADIMLLVQDYLNLEVQVDEIDVRHIDVGQPVRIVVDAFPDSDLSGRITKIAPTASNVGGIVAYQVTIVPDPSASALRPGMSATAVITTIQSEDVPLLLNRFIQLDRNSGQAYVYLMQDEQQVVLQEIELGLRNETSSEIVSGLEVGDVVALVLDNTEDQFRGALFQRGN